MMLMFFIIPRERERERERERNLKIAVTKKKFVEKSQCTKCSKCIFKITETESFGLS
jgi:TPP-dependent indolepyruvate ferredoxin oxidoreductase alpha subunit